MTVPEVDFPYVVLAWNDDGFHYHYDIEHPRFSEEPVLMDKKSECEESIKFEQDMQVKFVAVSRGGSDLMMKLERCNLLRRVSRVLLILNSYLFNRVGKREIILARFTKCYQLLARRPSFFWC